MPFDLRMSFHSVSALGSCILDWNANITMKYSTDRHDTTLAL